MKDILTTALGMFMFGDVMLEFKNLMGVVVGLVGGITYGALQYHSSQEQKRAGKPAYRPLPATGSLKSPTGSLSAGTIKGPLGSLKGTAHHKVGSP